MGGKIGTQKGVKFGTYCLVIKKPTPRFCLVGSAKKMNQGVKGLFLMLDSIYAKS